MINKLHLELNLGKSIIILPRPSLFIKYGVAPKEPVEWNPMCITPGMFSGSILNNKIIENNNK